MKKISAISLLLLFSGCMIFKNMPPVSSPEMILVKGGTFYMGDVFEQNNKDALPVHEAIVEDFYLGRYEVTFEEYDEFAKATGHELPDDEGHGRGKRAVVHVSWDEALAYCNYFGFRLPTEREWEYAARAGGKDYLFSGTSNKDSLKYFSISETRHSFFVGAKKPNPLGFYDMSGNVFEWIGSYYQFYNKPENLHDLENSRMRIIRGGSFSDSGGGNIHETYWRIGVLSYISDYDIGFRCAVSAKDRKSN